ncbi:hypothetical protein [Nocardioides campestrisoli]|uniref:hypothetical protein n=1 Tax=Nocardioides campestrisoli TaxID=2736757 RepID=UPI0015E6BF78|nr:hypothetical protein [Nocardioides campestrisoli]
MTEGNGLDRRVPRVRQRLGLLVWLVCATCALVLALGALLVALEADQRIVLVDAVTSGAAMVDLAVFDAGSGVVQFTGEDAAVKNALVNWGLAAAVWLLLGRLLDGLLSR